MDACVGWAGALGKRGRLVLVGYHAGDKHDFRYVKGIHPFSVLLRLMQNLNLIDQ
jgi:hypothetical protein